MCPTYSLVQGFPNCGSRTTILWQQRWGAGLGTMYFCKHYLTGWLHGTIQKKCKFWCTAVFQFAYCFRKRSLGWFIFKCKPNLNTPASLPISSLPAVTPCDEYCFDHNYRDSKNRTGKWAKWCTFKYKLTKGFSLPVLLCYTMSHLRSSTSCAVLSIWKWADKESLSSNNNKTPDIQEKQTCKIWEIKTGWKTCMCKFSATNIQCYILWSGCFMRRIYAPVSLFPSKHIFAERQRWGEIWEQGVG